MNDVNKVSASAGAQWLLDGFAALRKAPLGLGLLGAIYGAIALLVAMVASQAPALMALQLLMMLAGPLLAGGVVFAVRSVEQGGQAKPAHLLEGFRSGRIGRLLLTLLPNIGALLLCVLLLVAMVGQEALVEMAQVMEQAAAQTQPDPAVFSSLPMGKLALWMLLSLLIGIVASFFTFVAIPEIMFTDSGAFAVMGRSFRACLRNLSALIVFMIVVIIAFIAIYIVVMILGVIARAIGGALAMNVVTQLLLMAVLMPVMMGAVYSAWKQMFGAATSAPAAVSSGFEA
ncbi:MAG: hypothetical protein M3Y70_04235 [Pseudomonadota bacterium]|nr:hypothetical protein [Pseudomonadota bacterium]